MKFDRRASIAYRDAINGERENRQWHTNCELRSDTDDQILFVGCASATGRAYKIYGGPANGGWNETIAPGAFKRTLSRKPDVVFLANHSGLPLARTTSNTMTLEEDSKGLAVEARLEPTDPDVQRLIPKIDRRDLTEMSFAFRVRKQRWTDKDGNEVESWLAQNREITEIDLDRGDVSTVTYGANPHTKGTLRVEESLAEITRLDADALITARAENPDLEVLIRSALATLSQVAEPATKKTMSSADALAIVARL